MALPWTRRGTSRRDDLPPSSKRSRRLPAMARLRLFRAMPGAALSAIPPGWLKTVSGRKPGHTQC